MREYNPYRTLRRDELLGNVLYTVCAIVMFLFAAGSTIVAIWG